MRFRNGKAGMAEVGVWRISAFQLYGKLKGGPPPVGVRGAHSSNTATSGAAVFVIETSFNRNEWASPPTWST